MTLRFNIFFMKMGFAFSLFLIISGCSTIDLSKYEEASKSWEKEIQQLEAKDKTEKDPDNAILFTGSSSIRLWKTIATDMQPYTVIQRGFGGSKFSDLYFYTERIVKPHDFRAVVIFVANDISGSNLDRTPKEVAATFQEIVKKIRAMKPPTPIFIIEITPTNSRWKVWPQIQEANNLMKKACRKFKDVHFIETGAAYLDEKRLPRSDLFIKDQLHPNEEGYKIWTAIIKKRLDEVLK